MSTKLGKSILRGLEQALAIEQGTAEPSRYVVHDASEFMLKARKAVRRGVAIHPGEFLREDFLNPLGMTAHMLAGRIKVPKSQVVGIVNERRGLDADLCLRLARLFRMTPEFWMNLQKNYELEVARKDWPGICKEVPMHPRDRKSGELEARKTA